MRVALSQGFEDLICDVEMDSVFYSRSSSTEEIRIISFVNSSRVKNNSVQYTAMDKYFYTC